MVRRVAKKDEAKPWAIYTRVSDPDEDANDLSQENQEKSCRAKAKTNGHAILDVLRDDFSGRFLYQRPALTRLRELVRTGAIAGIYVWKLDRLSRKQAQRAILVDELRQHNVAYLSATEEITNSPEGRLLESVLGAIAEFELERTLERSQGSIQLIKDAGLPVCAGGAKFGYRYEVDRVQRIRRRAIVEAEAEIVKQVFKLCLLGLSSRQIAIRLQALGVPSPAAYRQVKRKQGTVPRWYSSTVRAILRDRSYSGAPMTSGKKKCTGEVTEGGNPKTCRTDPSDWWETTEGTPAIIDPDTFAQAQAALGAHKGARAARTRNEQRPYLLRGMVKCGVCGRTMSPQPHTSQGKKYVYYVCNSIKDGPKCAGKASPQPWLDDQVWQEVAARMTDRGVMEQHLASVAREHSSDVLERDSEAHKKAIEEARTSIRRLTAFIGGSDDPEILAPFQAKIGELRGVIMAHQAELDSATARLTIAANQRAALDRWWRACERGRAQIQAGKMTFEEKRLLVESLSVQVRGNGRKVNVSFDVDLPPSGDLFLMDDSAGRALHNEQLRISFQFAISA
jgi:site-specific DNA recombinase